MNELEHEQAAANLADIEARLDYLKKRTPSGEDATSEDFDSLVEAEIRKGVPRSIAAQRVLQKYGARPNASAIRKGQVAAGDFNAEVDAVVIEKRCSRTKAMAEVRKRHPELFEALREA